MAKLVDAWDLKSPARKGVPVRFRVRAPSKIKGLRAKANAGPCLFSVRNFKCRSVTHLVGVTFEGFHFENLDIRYTTANQRHPALRFLYVELGRVIGGEAVLGYQAAYWSLAEKQSNQVTDIRKAYDAAMGERDKRLEELPRKTGTAAAQAADKADEAQLSNSVIRVDSHQANVLCRGKGKTEAIVGAFQVGSWPLPGAHPVMHVTMAD